MDHFWTLEGPTPEASHARRALGRPLSGSRRLVLLAAFDLWDQKGLVDFGALIDQLALDELDRLLSLALAVKAEDDRALDQWLVRYDADNRIPT